MEAKAGPQANGLFYYIMAMAYYLLSSACHSFAPIAGIRFAPRKHSIEQSYYITSRLLQAFDDAFRRSRLKLGDGRIKFLKN